MPMSEGYDGASNFPYIDFVKKYMKKEELSWTCAVCDIKEKGLWVSSKDKKREERQIRRDEKKAMGAEDKPKKKKEPKAVKVKKSIKDKVKSVVGDEDKDAKEPKKRLKVVKELAGGEKPKPKKKRLKLVEELVGGDKPKPKKRLKVVEKLVGGEDKSPSKSKSVKSDDYTDKQLIDEFDTPQFTYLLYGSKHKSILDSIEKLKNKGSAISPAGLFYLTEQKKLISKLYDEYSIKVIDKIMVDLIEDQGGNAIKGDYKGYLKALSAKQKKRLNDELTKS
jgi:hypothetical protein